MAESKFLPFQDIDNDGIIDVCDKVTKEPEIDCRCKPNPCALVTNWRDRKLHDSFLNEKECKYQITKTTRHTTTGANKDSTEQEADKALKGRYEEHLTEVIGVLLKVNNKNSSDESVEALKSCIEYSDWSLDARPLSRLKLLYSISVDTLNAMPPAEPEDEEEEEEEEGDIEVTYDAGNLELLLLTARKGLHLYSRHLKVYRALENSNILFREDDVLFNLDDYGDFGIFNGSIVGSILPQLDAFLNQKGYNIPGVGKFGGFRQDLAGKLVFTFDKDYKIKKLIVYTAACPNDKNVFIDGLDSLREGSAWKDPTAMAYFTKLKEMEVDLNSQVPLEWVEFIEKYTYPEVYSVTNFGWEGTTGSCVGNALRKEAKQFGQDILDEAFSIGDALAYQFHKAKLTGCQTPDELKKIKAEMALLSPAQKRSSIYSSAQASDRIGYVPDPPTDSVQTELTGSGTEAKIGHSQFGEIGTISSSEYMENFDTDPDRAAENTIMTMATAQAFQELSEKNPLGAWLCQGILTGTGAGKYDFGSLHLILDRAKICGILDLMLTSIECLFKGFSLDDALRAVIVSALGAMSIESFGQLFQSLTPEEQAELDALVEKHVVEIEAKKECTEAGGEWVDATEDTPQGKCTYAADVAGESRTDEKYLPEEEIATSTDINISGFLKRPWEDEEVIEAERKTLSENSYTSMTPSATAAKEEQIVTRTLAPSLDETGEEDEPDNAIMMQAYAAATIEYFSGRFLELADKLMGFPGAEVVARILATINLLTCPVPPSQGWSFSELLNGLGDLPNPCPGCFNGNEFRWPRWPDWRMPPWKDIFRFLFDQLKLLIQQAMIKILIMLIVKICEVLGNAICKALETAGDVAASLPDLVTGKDNLKNIIRESICGESADDAAIEAAIIELIGTLGVGGAAMADEQQTLSFAEDISSAVTQKELTDAFLGNPSASFLEIVDSLVEFEYTDFRKGLKSRAQIASMFKNMGNLMPADLRDELKGEIMDEQLPANPSLCASPEQLDQFCELRSSLLEGRASKAQLEKLCAPDLTDLEDLSRVMQDIPGYLACSMPPIVSDPGCDNGFLPFEPEELAAATTAAVGGQIEALKASFSIDMLGNGPGEKNWGMVNMILSDTLGNPLTAHLRKASNKRRYVDFYMNLPDVDLDNLSAADLATLLLGPPMLREQKGAFPKTVAGWLQQTLKQLDVDFSSSNDFQGDQSFSKSFKDLGGTSRAGVNILGLPDIGYNTEIEVSYDAETVQFIEKGRKKTPDVILEFEDNAKGLKEGPNGGQSEYAYGFDLEMYLSDLVRGPVSEEEESSSPSSCQEEEDSVMEGVETRNRLGDSVRIRIIDKLNTTADVDVAAESMILDESSKKEKKEKKIIKEQRCEFLSVDTILDEVDLEEYPEFLLTFKEKQEFLPQIVLLKEILKNNNNGSTVGESEIKNFHDEFMSSFLKTVLNDVAENDAAYAYGAQIDDLSKEDARYVTSDGQDYSDTDYRNRDMVLGMSYDQYVNEKNKTPENTRVFYLDPTSFGGSYTNPPVYVKPPKNEGWLGFVDVFFPEMCPCKPGTTDLVDFGEIQDMIDDVYPNIPEDERLQEDKDCAVEMPYNRILERSSTAAIQGIITAALRIYASTHLIKSMATFTKFTPRFTEVFSSIYACYIIEDMEERFKDAQPDLGEAFSTFKDEEFWYAFLEQSVQMYARLVESGDLTPSKTALDALIRLNDMQESYHWPTKDDLRAAKRNDEVKIFKTLKNYRSDKNLEAIKETEEDAKLILKELVVEQLNYMGMKFIKNLETIGMAPDVYDLDYYLLENFTQGSSLNIRKEPKPIYPNLPTEGDDYYTSGNEFVVKEDRDGTSYKVGDEYIGYYHVEKGEDGDIIFVAGEISSGSLDIDEEEAEEAGIEMQDILLPMAHMIQYEIGDIEEYPASAGTSKTQPFVIEKYININGTRMGPTAAAAQIQSNDPILNISDVYPGTLELSYDNSDTPDTPTGIFGELGVRHGLLFSIFIGGTKYEVTSVEIDALDTMIGDFKTISANSKLLLCLINQLKEDDKFRLMVHYIFPVSKFTALAAIYNDLAFLPSIGEVTVKDGNAFGPDSNVLGDGKPGTYVETVRADTGETFFTTKIDEERSVEGWASVKDRSPGLFGGLLVREWDNWDQVVLKKSNRMIKKLFKPNYNSRDFDTSRDQGDRSSQRLLGDLKNRMKPSPGQRVLPRWRWRRMRTNPFNIDGELCEK